IGVNCVGLGMLPVKPGSCAKAVVGYDVRVLGEDGQELPSGQTGNIVIRLPLPPGCLPTLWHNDEGYVRSYVSRYPGYYLTADAGYKDADGYLWVMGRTDDIINVAGHRLSTGAMEEVLASHPDVAECAVVGVADKIKGEIPLGLVVLKAGVQRPAAALAVDAEDRPDVAQVRPRHGASVDQQHLVAGPDPGVGARAPRDDVVDHEAAQPRSPGDQPQAARVVVAARPRCGSGLDDDAT